MCCAEVSESFTGCPWPGWARSFPRQSETPCWEGHRGPPHHIPTLHPPGLHQQSRNISCLWPFAFSFFQ